MSCLRILNVVQIAVTPLPVGGTVTRQQKPFARGKLKFTPHHGGSTGPLVTIWQESRTVLSLLISPATSADYQPPALNATRWYKRITNGEVHQRRVTMKARSFKLLCLILMLERLIHHWVRLLLWCDSTYIDQFDHWRNANDASSAIGTVTYRWEMQTMRPGVPFKYQ